MLRAAERRTVYMDVWSIPFPTELATVLAVIARAETTTDPLICSSIHEERRQGAKCKMCRQSKMNKAGHTLTAHKSSVSIQPEIRLTDL